MMVALADRDAEVRETLRLIERRAAEMDAQSAELQQLIAEMARERTADGE